MEIDSHYLSSKTDVQNSFTILSLNVLAPAYIRNHLYCESAFLKQYYRFHNLASRLVELKCDIIALQEMQQDTFNYMKNNLSNYDCYFTQRSKHVDGLALFISKEKFTRESEFIDLHISDPTEGDRKMLYAICRTNNNFKIILCTTHFSGGAKRHLRAFEIEAITSHINSKYDLNNTGFILCGDFNFTPEDQIYKNLTQTETYGLQLKNIFMGEEPPFTCYTEKFKKTLDYIFYSSKWIEKTKNCSVLYPTEEGPYPNKSWCSDHIPLKAEFSIKPNPTNTTHPDHPTSDPTMLSY